MLNEKIISQWVPYEGCLPAATLESLLTRPINLCEEAPEILIPSLRLATDRVVVSSIFVFTNSFMLEVEVGGRRFDIISRKSVLRFDFNFGDLTISEEGKTPVVWAHARVEIGHGGILTSVLEHVGRGQEEWLAALKLALPFRLLGPSKIGDFGSASHNI